MATSSSKLRSFNSRSIGSMFRGFRNSVITSDVYPLFLVDKLKTFELTAFDNSIYDTAKISHPITLTVASYCTMRYFLSFKIDSGNHNVFGG